MRWFRNLRLARKLALSFAVLLGLTAGLGLFALAIRLGEILVQLSIVPAYGVARVELRRLLDDLQPAGDDLHALGSTLVHSVGGTVVLLVILVLNVYKPRGMTRYGWRKQEEQRGAARHGKRAEQRTARGP